MKHPLVNWLVGTLAVMLGIPFAMVTLVQSDAAMLLCLLLFFAVNPLFSLLAGAAAGRDPRRLWPLPFLCAGAYILGAWLCFDMAEGAFFIYGGAYLLLGLLAMFFSWLTRRIRQRKSKKPIL